MPIKFSLLKYLRTLIEGGASNGPVSFLLQDYIIHINNLAEGLDFIIKEAEVWPIWLCPATKKCPEEIQHLTKYTSDQLFVDVGVYG